MKCPKCNKEFLLKIATKAQCSGCKILTNLTSILTIQCEECNHVFQIPVTSKSFMSVNNEDN